MSEDEFRRAMGLALRDARRRSGLTQVDAAEALGTHQPVVSRWENGRQTIDSYDLARAAAAYGTSPSDILADDNVADAAKRLAADINARHFGGGKG